MNTSSDKTYFPSEIADKITGITPRMITDLAQKGVVIPVRPSSEAGKPRLYSKENILEIMLAITMRGMFSHHVLLATMELLKKNIDSPISFLIIMQTNRSKKSIPLFRFIKEGEEKKYLVDSLKMGLHKDKQLEGTGDINMIDKYSVTVVNIADMKKFILTNF